MFPRELDACTLLVRHIGGNLFVNLVPPCERLSLEQSEDRRMESLKGVRTPISLWDKGGPAQQLPVFQPPSKSGVRWQFGAKLLPASGRNPLRAWATNLV